MTTSEEKKCCWECGHHGVGCIPNCYPEHCHNRACPCHSTPVREELEEEAEMLQKNYPSPELALLERLEEGVGKMKRGLKKEKYGRKSSAKLDEVLSLITHFKKEI